MVTGIDPSTSPVPDCTNWRSKECAEPSPVNCAVKVAWPPGSTDGTTPVRFLNPAVGSVATTSTPIPALRTAPLMAASIPAFTLVPLPAWIGK